MNRSALGLSHLKFTPPLWKREFNQNQYVESQSFQKIFRKFVFQICAGKLFEENFGRSLSIEFQLKLDIEEIGGIQLEWYLISNSTLFIWNFTLN